MTVTYDLGCELGELGINNQNPKMKCFVWLCLWHSWGILGVRPRIPKIKCFVCCILGILAGFLGFTPTAGILAMLLISMCRRCPFRKHHVFQWFSQAPLADPHLHRMDRHSAAVWWKAENVDFTKDFARFGHHASFLHSALSGQTVKSSRFSIVFERFCWSTWGHADLVERVPPT